MVAPGGATVTRGLVFDQPLQGGFGLCPPRRVSRRLMEPHETSRQESHSLRRLALLDTKRGTQVDRETTDCLLKNGAQQVCLEGQRTKKSGIQAVKSIVPTVVILLQPIIQTNDGLKNLFGFFSCSRRDLIA